MTETMTPLLRVEHLSKWFHIHQLERRIPVFEELSFHLHPGEFLLVRGSNGAGKSTLLRCLYRTYLPTSGHAYYAARASEIDLAHAADIDIAFLRKHEIGHVTQFLRPRPRVSALELVTEPLRLLGRDSTEVEEEAQQWLAAFGLKQDIWQAYPSTFSGGEQQKVNLVRALIAPRRLLLLDEPTASLDRQTRAVLVERLRLLKEQGVAMIGVFHQTTSDVRALVDREIRLTVTEPLPG